MPSKSSKTTFFTLEGDIFKLESISGKLSVSIFDASKRAFVKDSFTASMTGSDLMASESVALKDLPAEVRTAASVS